MRAPLTRLLDGLMDFRPVSARVIDSLDYIGQFSLAEQREITGRLVLSVAQLVELADILGPLPRLALLASSIPQSRTEWEDVLAHDAQTVTAFLRQRPAAEIELYEVTLPADLPVTQAIRDLGGFREVDVFVTVPESDAPDAIATLAETDWLGVATPLRQTETVLACLDLEVNFRLHGDADTYWRDIAQLVFARAHDLTPGELQARQAEPWQVTNRQIMWGDLAVDEVEIEELRVSLDSVTHPDIRAFYAAITAM